MPLLARSTDPRRVALHLLVASTAAAAVLYAVYRYAPFLYDPAAQRAYVRAAGPVGPLVFIALQAAQVVVAPIPGQLTAVAAGYLFGWPGLVYSLVGVTIGSALAFALARRFGRPYVERVLDPELLATFDGVLEDTGDVGLAVVFLVPGLPDDVVCFLAGLSPIPVRRLILLSFFARLPAYALANAMGASAAQREFGRALLLLAVFVLAAGLGWRFRDAIVARLRRWRPAPPP